MPCLDDRSPRIRRCWDKYQQCFPTVLFLGLFLLSTAAATLSWARVPVPTPPGGGPGVNSYAADQQHLLDLAAPVRPQLPKTTHRQHQKSRDATIDDLGGDDVWISTSEQHLGRDLAIASNGHLFALEWDPFAGTSYNQMTLRRSTDGGTSWHIWADFYPSTSASYHDAVLHIAEGLNDRVFVAYALDTGSGQPTEIRVAWSPLDLEYGDFSHDTLIHTGPHVQTPTLTSDAASFDAYYLYLTWSSNDGNGADIHFARSTNRGNSWESPYVLAAISVADRGYYTPQVAVGHDGWVHVAWHLGFPYNHSYDSALRYRRAASYADGGLSAWEPMQSLTSAVNGIDEVIPRLATSLVSGDVMLVWHRGIHGHAFLFDGTGSMASADHGATWGEAVQTGEDLQLVGDVLHQETTTRWVMSLNDGVGWGVRWAALAAPQTWSDVLYFADRVAPGPMPHLALDPSHDHRLAILANQEYSTDPYRTVEVFDAEWRADPGYPNLEDGFPVALPAEPVSDLGLADINGDGNLEIVFGDADGNIQIYRHDGTPLPGWPVSTGAMLSASPIAVGDLNGDGIPAIVAGGTEGQIFAHAPDGSVLPGWPWVHSMHAPMHVAIGAIGGPHPRAVVWTSDVVLGFRDHTGQAYPGAIGRLFGGYEVFTCGPVIGDVSGNGVNDVVVALGSEVRALPPMSAGSTFWYPLPAAVSDRPALADLDQDGDVEVLVPLASGQLYVHDDDGALFEGWPVTVSDAPLRSPVVASFLGDHTLHIAVVANGDLIHLLKSFGTGVMGWPVEVPAGPTATFSSAIVGRVGNAMGVLLETKDWPGIFTSYLWTWDSTGALVSGWPRWFHTGSNLSPAYGDVDLDGRAEIAFFADSKLYLTDINTPPGSAAQTWAMAAHDPERSGCANCVSDVVAAPDDPDAVTRVSLAAPYPNPVTGPTVFSFAVPVRARVELTIHDVRGRRVARVTRQEVDLGRHTVGWHGRDDQDRTLPSGQYLAILSVHGPGVKERISRKITLLR